MKLQLHAVLRKNGKELQLEIIPQTPCFIGEEKGLLSKTTALLHLEPTVSGLLSNFPARTPVVFQTQVPHPRATTQSLNVF